MLKHKTSLRIIINSLIGSVLIIIWLKFVSLEEIFKVLAQTKINIAAIFFVFFLASAFLRSLRLKVLLKRYNLPIKELTCLSLLGQFLSFSIPIRAGEIAKGLYLSNRFKLPFGQSLIWVLIDRFLDFWTNLLLISTLLFVVTVNIPANLANFLKVAFLLFSLAVSFILISNALIKKLTLVISRFIFIDSLKKVFLKVSSIIIDGFAVLQRKPSELLILIVLSILALISDWLMWHFVFISVGVYFKPLEGLLGSLLSALTFLIPSLPGYVGSAEAANLAVFGGILGLDPNLASAGAVLYHILAAVALLVTGIASIYFLKFDLGRLWQKIKRED